jgi:hypothetical protein
MFGGTMNTEEIIRHIDGEISKLQQARVLLLGSDSPTKKGPGRPKATSSTPKKRILTAAGRARISAALKKRWAEKRNTVEAVKKAVPAKAVAAKKVAAKKSAKKATALSPIAATKA